MVEPLTQEDCDVAYHWTQPQVSVEEIEGPKEISELHERNAYATQLIHHGCYDIEPTNFLVEEWPYEQGIIDYSKAQQMTQEMKNTHSLMDNFNNYYNTPQDIVNIKLIRKRITSIRYRMVECLRLNAFVSWNSKFLKKYIVNDVIRMLVIQPINPNTRAQPFV